MKRTIEHEKELAKQIMELIKKKDIDAINTLVRRNKILELRKNKR